MASLVLNVDTEASATELTSRFEDGNKEKALNELVKLFGAIEGGSVKRTVVRPSATVSFSGTGAANDTIVVNGVTFTAVAAGATGNQWNVGASAAATAIAVRDAINNSATGAVKNFVQAIVESSAVVTIYATAGGGTAQNGITLTEGTDAGNVMTVSSPTLKGGVNGNAVVDVSVKENGVRAFGTLTFTGVAAANDVITINGVALTCKNSGAAANEWNKGTTTLECAQNFANAVSASTTNALISGHISASVAAGVVTLSSLFYGVAGNAVTVVETTDSGNVMALTNLTNGRLATGAADASAVSIAV